MDSISVHICNSLSKQCRTVPTISCIPTSGGVFGCRFKKEEVFVCDYSTGFY